MNHFAFHIGDYAQATGHLTFLEDAAYSRLLRKYYAEEKPIPGDLKAAQRLVGARTREEREAVQTVLEEFFELREDGWHQGRCDFEIARYHEVREESEDKRENENERQKRHRAERKQMFATLRERGYVPAWDTSTTTLRGMLSLPPVTPPVTPPDTTGDAPVTPPVTRTATANHYPIPITHYPETNSEGESTRKRAPAQQRPDDVAEQVWKDWVQLRKAKRATVSVTVLAEARKEAEKAGLTLERFLSVWCARGSQGLQADWLKAHERGQQATTQTGYGEKNYDEGFPK